MKYLVNVVIGIFGFFILMLFTKGRILNLLEYGSLLIISISIILFGPIILAEFFARLYLFIDRNPERNFWISGAIRSYGVFSGLRNVHSTFYKDDSQKDPRKKF